MKRNKKTVIAVMLSLVTCMSCLAGCGKTDTEEHAVKNDGKGELISDEDAAALEYVEKYMVGTINESGASYPVYAPDGSDCNGSFLNYAGHGIAFGVLIAFDGDEEEMPYLMLNQTLEGQKEDMEGSELYSDVELGEVIENGADRYAVLSASGKDSYGTPCEEKRFLYLDVPGQGVGVIWQVYVMEEQVDETTQIILAQLGQCYGISLESIMPDGEWAQADAQRQVEEQDVYEPEEDESGLTKVDDYQYLGQASLSFEEGEIRCPAMAPMGRNTSLREDSASGSIHGVAVYASGSSRSYKGIDEYRPRMEKNAESAYEQKVNDESVEYRDVHKSDVKEMSGFENAWYYILDYEAPDLVEGGYYREAKAECWIVIGENYILDCNITLSANKYDEATNAVIKEVETAYGLDLSAYYNEE